MAETTLRKEEGGDGYGLRRPGQYEAQIIDYASVFAVAVDFGAFLCPVKEERVPCSYEASRCSSSW